MGYRLLAASLSLSVLAVGLIAGCGEGEADDVEDALSSEDELKGKRKVNSFAEVSCNFTNLMKCAYPSKCKPAAGLGKGRKVTLLIADPTNGHYRVKELKNNVPGWVAAKCLKPSAAPKNDDAGSDDAGPDAEPVADIVPPPPPSPSSTGEAPSGEDEANDEQPPRSVNEREEEVLDKRPTPARAGCGVNNAPASAGNWWLFALATLPLLRRKSRRPPT